MISKKWIVYILVISTLSSFAQSKIEIAKIIKQNDLVDFASQPLVLVDFWATWCAPCVPATQQLEIYQKQLKNKVYMLAISDEPSSKISNYLGKTPIQIAVAEGQTKNFRIPYRPYTVILNQKGKTVWKGKPGNLDVSILKKIAEAQPKTAYQFDDLFSFQTEKHIEVYQKKPKDTEEFYASAYSGAENDALDISETRVSFKGSISKLVARILKEPFSSVFIDKDFKIDFSCDTEVWNNKENLLIRRLESRFNFELKHIKVKETVHQLKIINPKKLWDNSQINWGAGKQSQHLLTEDRLQADNYSIHQLALLLSNVKKQRFIYKGNDERLYDWNFHYLYDELMVDELSYEFGIELMSRAEQEVSNYQLETSQ